jgi:hypothetical protein
MLYYLWCGYSAYSLNLLRAHVLIYMLFDNARREVLRLSRVPCFRDYVEAFPPTLYA